MISELKKVSVCEIAKIAEVSPSTVSRALNDNPTISQATKVKILEIANKLQNNSYKTSKYDNGLKLCFYTESWNISLIFEGMHNKLANTDHDIIFVSNRNGDLDIASFRKKGFDGIIFLGNPKKLLKIMPNLDNIPAIQILGHEKIEGFPVANITYNSYLVAEIMIKYLKHLGSRICYINSKSNTSINVSRRENLIQYHAKLNGCELSTFTYDDELLGIDIEKFVENIKNIPEEKREKLLIACYDDEILENIVFWFTRNGLVYKKDYMIIGCNNILKLESMATIDLKFNQIGELALDELIRRINNEVTLNYTLSLEPELILT